MENLLLFSVKNASSILFGATCIIIFSLLVFGGEKRIQNLAEDSGKNGARKFSDWLIKPIIYISLLFGIVFIVQGTTGKDLYAMFLMYCEKIYIKAFLDYLTIEFNESINTASPSMSEFAQTKDLDTLGSSIYSFFMSQIWFWIIWIILWLGAKVTKRSYLHPWFLTKIISGLLLFGFALYAFWNWSNAPDLNMHTLPIPIVGNDPEPKKATKIQMKVFSIPKSMLNLHPDKLQYEAQIRAEKLKTYLRIPDTNKSAVPVIQNVIIQAIQQNRLLIRAGYGVPDENYAEHAPELRVEIVFDG